MKKLLLIFFALGTLFLTGCEVLFGIVLVPCLLIDSGYNAVSATVGEHFDAWSDLRARTVFSLEIPKGEPFEKICVDGEYKHVESDCRFVILYRRKSEFIWPLRFYVVNDHLGSEFTRVDRYKPVYESNPVLWGKGCLISPEAEDEIVVLAASDTFREIGCFTVPFSKLNDFTGSYDKNGLYNTCFFSGIFGKRFPHKVIKVPAWEKLSLLDGESKKYYLEKIFGESDRRRIRAQREWKEYLQRAKED